MIYSKVENPKCSLCANGEKQNSAKNIKCKIKGIIPEDFYCKKFKYDIFKKVIKPKKVLHTNQYNENDFTI